MQHVWNKVKEPGDLENAFQYPRMVKHISYVVTTHDSAEVIAVSCTR
jgi:hypothetical protein